MWYNYSTENTTQKIPTPNIPMYTSVKLRKATNINKVYLFDTFLNIKNTIFASGRKQTKNALVKTVGHLSQISKISDI